MELWTDVPGIGRGAALPALKGRHLLLAACLALFPLVGVAQDTKDSKDPGTDETVDLTDFGLTAESGKLPWETFDERLKGVQSPTALDAGLFGDQVNLQNGGLSFEVTDVSLPGNSGLPVAFTRRYEVINHKDHNGADGMLGDWNVVVPSISGSFAKNWESAGTAGNRCSDRMPPPVPDSEVDLTEFWHGIHIDIPGVGGGELLTYDPATHPDTPIPTNGASYKWVTNDHIRVSCPTTLDVANGSGEGFLAITPDGTTYEFDWMAQYFEPALETLLVTPEQTLTQVHERRKNVLYARKATDRFGNQVVYTYSNDEDEPGRLTRIEADDGRYLQLTYTNGRVSSVTDGNRTWSYSYDTTNDGRPTLVQVDLPGSGTGQWTIDFEALTDAEIKTQEWGESDRMCHKLETLPVEQDPAPVGVVIHPSGAEGSFTLEIQEHGRSNVPLNCGHVTTYPSGAAPGTGNDRADDVNLYVISSYSFTLTQKEISGPGLDGEPLVWSYVYDYESEGGIHQFPGQSLFQYPVCPYLGIPYDPGNPDDPSELTCHSAPCTSGVCGSTFTTVNGPNNEWTRHQFGNSFRYNEGKLLSIERGKKVAEGVVTTLETTTKAYDLSLVDQGYPASYGASIQPQYDGDANQWHRPLVRTDTTRQQETFTWEILDSCTEGYCADAFAHPETVKRHSTLGQSRTETTSYKNDMDDWVIGQVEISICNESIPTSDTCDDVEVSRTTFNSKAQPWTQEAFGKLQHTLTYNSNGTLATYKDGRNNVTSLSNWYRGVPQLIQYPGGVSESATVDPDGSITSVTNEAGAKTCYQYDILGRLQQITYPSESQTGVCNASAWEPTMLSYTFGTSSYVDATDPHWTQTVQTGDSVKVSYFDALWRPLVVRDYDSGNPSGSDRFTIIEYDHAGRPIFASYPGDSWPLPLIGVFTVYDQLGRVISVSQTAEPSLDDLVTTSTSYLSDFRTRVSNPNGNATTTSYMAYDQPATDWPAAIAHPEGAYTDIVRDPFGKPLSITRRNSGSSVSLTRSYVYNAQQELCKQVEPETAVSVSTFDAAGNLDWTATGQTALNVSNCSDLSSVPSNQRVLRQYDVRNRITDLVFPDGNGDQAWSYTADGMPDVVTTWNDAGQSWVVNDYAYNRRGLLIEESQYQPGTGNLWSIQYHYDDRGYLESHTYPDSTTVAYDPDYMGRATRSGSSATGASYHANGALAQFTYGNGIVHVMEQNERGLPELSRDAYGGTAFHDDGLVYDANGNVLHISDGLPGADGTRTMTYDDLDRLLTTISPFGSMVATYGYDVLDNLIRVKAPGRDHYFCYPDGTNRLTNISDQSCGGTGTDIALGYDDRGNLSSKDGSGYMFDFDFDLGNRLRETDGKESYRYDAHGRRIQATDLLTGKSIFSVYGHDGVLRYQRDERAGEAVRYLYLAGSLVGRGKTALATAGPVLGAGTVDTTTGDYTLSWTATGGNYKLDESDDDGVSWTQVADTTLTSWSADNKSNDTYRYRVRGCDPACSSYSNSVAVTVVRKPTVKPVINQPTFGSTELHTFTVAWTSVQYAATYQLQQRSGGGWSTIQNNGATSKSVTVPTDGTYEFQVAGCSSISECGPFSDIKLVEVGPVPEPPDTPVLTVPASSTTGNYTISWSPETGTTEYVLQEGATGSGPWTTVYGNGTALSKAFSNKPGGVYHYQVKACAGALCSAFSASDSIAVAPGVPVLTVPAGDANGDYNVSWTAKTGATEYNLEEREVGASTWQSAYDGGTNLSLSVVDHPGGNYQYRVQACTTPTVCSAWSSAKSIALLPPATGPTIDAPGIDADGDYTITGSLVAYATQYRLYQHKNNAANWSWIDTTPSAIDHDRGDMVPAQYEYRASACNTYGCGPYGPTILVEVGPPTTKPVITAPATSSTGDYTVSWTTVPRGDTYELQQKIGTGSWANQTHSGTSKTYADQPSATYSYRARGCRGTCGPWATTKTVTVTLPPPNPPPVPTGLRVDLMSTTSCMADWNASSGAATYQLRKGPSSTIYDGPNTHYWYKFTCNNESYVVRACNAGGCSAWSGAVWATPPALWGGGEDE